MPKLCVRGVWPEFPAEKYEPLRASIRNLVKQADAIAASARTA